MAAFVNIKTWSSDNSVIVIEVLGTDLLDYLKLYIDYIFLAASPYCTDSVLLWLMATSINKPRCDSLLSLL